LPQLITAVLAVVVVALLVAAARARRRLPARRDQRGGAWWTLLATPMAGDVTAQFFIGGLWDLLRGGANVRQPSSAELSRRYADPKLGASLAILGSASCCSSRDSMPVDVVFATRPSAGVRTCSNAFFAQRARAKRPCLYYDIGGCAGPCVPEVPGVTEAPFIAFAPESYWRGETHRISDRPASLVRVLEEVAHAGVHAR
jgi:hypothetical protein